jgi:hypothetical protein
MTCGLQASPRQYPEKLCAPRMTSELNVVAAPSKVRSSLLASGHRPFYEHEDPPMQRPHAPNRENRGHYP